jgi:excisionase family DNA binding protein
LRRSSLRRPQDDQFVLPFVAVVDDSARPSGIAPKPERPLLPSAPSFPAPEQPKTSQHHAPERKNTNGKPPAKANLTPDSKVLVSREEAAAMLSISVRAVDYLIATKRLSTRRIGTRVLIPVEDVRKFARSDHPERMAG